MCMDRGEGLDWNECSWQKAPVCSVVDEKTWRQKKVEQNELPRISAVYA